LRDALDEVSEKTKWMQQVSGWAIDKTSTGLVFVSRPKKLPMLDEVLASPSEYQEILSSEMPPESAYWTPD